MNSSQSLDILIQRILVRWVQNEHVLDTHIHYLEQMSFKLTLLSRFDLEETLEDLEKELIETLKIE